MNRDKFKLPGLEIRRIRTVQFLEMRAPPPLSALPGTIEARLKTAVKEDLFLNGRKPCCATLKESEAAMWRPSRSEPIFSFIPQRFPLIMST